MSEIEGADNKTYKPYENTGIEEGDTIIEINENEILSTDALIEMVNESKGNELSIKYIHENETNELLNIASGEFVTTEILNISKGEKGSPGKIQGTIDTQKTIGDISKNTSFGIYGSVQNVTSLNIDKSKEMDVALRDEIKVGKATILCSLDNKNVEEYEIEIEKIYLENNYNNKSMEIKVTDERLIEKTGGIIQGMSGSPIIQNGKFVGAVTHVLVNDSLEGYAVFGDLMIKQSREIN